MPRSLSEAERQSDQVVTPREQEAADSLLLLHRCIRDFNVERQGATMEHLAYIANLAAGVDGSDDDEFQRPVDFGPRTSSPRTEVRSRRARSNKVSEDVPCERVRAPSTAAIESRDWCHTLKLIDPKDLQAFAPPRSAFERVSIPSSSTLSKYSPDCARNYQADPDHPHLAVPEQQLIAGFGESLPEAQYLACKARIFACHRWRTLEDGRNHNIESSQQCCAIDVRVVSVMHKWFDASGLFEQAKDVADTPQRPAELKSLRLITGGRNGRGSSNTPARSA